MDKLHNKYNEYMRLNNCTAEYTLANEEKISVQFSETSFLHLLGLHKLLDISDIQFWQDKNNNKIHTKDIIRKIKNEQIIESTIKASSFFPDIKSRYNSFTYDNLTTLTYTDAIINFDASQINSKLKSDYILFEENPTGEYNHLGIAKDPITNTRYFETFIHEKSSGYIQNQTVVKITSLKILDPQGKIIIEDKFVK